MGRNLFLSGTLGLAVLSGQAAAVGFGDITVSSRVGEPLRAEVGILSASQEAIDTACFSLAANRGSELPVITSARLTLVKDGQRYRLVIAGTTPIADPIFILALRAGCGIDVQRDYVLMPQAPISLAEASPLPPAPAGVAEFTKRKPAGRQWRASAGETLEGIAEALVPTDIGKQRQILAALQRANPEWPPTTALAEGTPIHIPSLEKPSSGQRPAAAKQRQRRPAATTAGSRPAAEPQSPAAAAEKHSPPAGSSDRLVLGAPPADFTPDERPAATRTPTPRPPPLGMEERLLQMESTVKLLNEEIARLDKALALASDVLIAQEKLQASRSILAAPTKVKAAASPSQSPILPPAPSASSWIELLASALGGGLIAALAAHFLAQRKKRAIDRELPLLVQVSPKPASVEPVPEDPIATMPAQISRPVAPSGIVEISTVGGEPALELAEIMLSFGRLQDACETLAEHIRESSPDQPKPWIMLLDLYHRSNMRREFETLASRFQEKFNTRPPAWDELTSRSGEAKPLERHLQAGDGQTVPG